MSKPSTISRRTANRLLEFLGQGLAVGELLPAEQRLADLCQASRTAVRSALAHLEARQVLVREGHRLRLARRGDPEDGFEAEDLVTATDRVRGVLMHRVFEGDLPPGFEFTESELAREAGVSNAIVREFLIGFARSGMIEKKPRGGWRLCAFDAAFGSELADVRQLFEAAAIGRFAQLPADHPAWREVDRLLARHQALAAQMPRQYAEFPALDRELHAFLISVLGNRFAQGFYDAISLVFHYHYTWDKRDEQRRNQRAVIEHLAILGALARRDVAAALAAMERHLATARHSMLEAIAERSPGPEAAR